MAELREQCSDLLDTIAAAVEEDRGRDAAVAVGGLRAFQGLLLALHPEPRQPAAEDEPFVDPASIADPPMRPKEDK